MPKYAVMSSGVGRCASKWLVSMFRYNVPNAIVSHEGFATRGAAQSNIWVESGDAALLVDISWKMFSLVYSFPFRPKMCVLLRDPLDIVQSWMTRRIVGTHVSPDFASKESFAYYYMLHYLFYLDSGIHFAKAAGLDISYWDYLRYTTPEGFTELADYVGADLKSPLQTVPPIDVRPKDQKIDIVEWCDGDTTRLERALDGFPHAKAAYEKVWSER